MTRQRIKQLANQQAGLCGYCSRPLHPGSNAFCWHHLIQRRAKRRKALGLRPGYVSGIGRPAITRLPMPETQFTQAAA